MPFVKLVKPEPLPAFREGINHLGHPIIPPTERELAMVRMWRIRQRQLAERGRRSFFRSGVPA